MSTLEPLLTWLETSVSGLPHVTPQPWSYWHARLMVMGWTILLPVGMLIARFFKITWRQDWQQVLDNKLWWRCHIQLQCAGLVLVLLGFAIALGRGAGASPMADAHRWGGLIVIGIGVLQLVSGMLRGTKGGSASTAMRGDHYDMTLRRVWFEYLHKTLGWSAMILAVFVTIAGLLLVDAPRWMAIVIGLWWIGYLLVFAWLQYKGRCVDTYQAIWGPDPAHPGNGRAPIGWGVKRLTVFQAPTDKLQRTK